jgi:hypothetical protein
MGILNKNQIDFFNREGYLVLKNIYTEKEINHLRTHFVNEFQAGYWKKSKYNSENIINCAKFCVKKKIKFIILSGFDENNKLRKFATKAELEFWINSKNYGIVELSHESILHSFC